MPYKFVTDKIPLPPGKDRRVKLTDTDREEIRHLSKTYSQRQLADMFGVSRRLISFVLDPEKLKQNLQRREERGGSMVYYEKNKNTAAIREHRRYKQSVLQEKIKNGNQSKSENFAVS